MAINLGSILTGGLGGMLGATPIGGALTGVMSAVKGTVAGGAGGVVGGQVVARGRGMMLIRAPSGRQVIVRTQKRRRYAPRSRGTSLDKMMQMAMIKSILK